MNTRRRNRNGQFRLLSIATTAGLLVMSMIATTGVASAHTPTVTLACHQSGPVLSINLAAYNSGGTNTVSATIDGGSVLAVTTFGGSYSGSFSAGSAYVGHTAQVVVTAWDDPTGSRGWTKTFNRTVPACLEPTPTPTLEPTPTPTLEPTPTPTLEPTPTPTPTATPEPEVTPTPVPTATPSGTVLAETGTPKITPPPTDGLGSPSTPSSGSWLLVVLGLASLVVAVVAVKPAPARKQN